MFFAQKQSGISLLSFTDFMLATVASRILRGLVFPVVKSGKFVPRHNAVVPEFKELH
jgi:hypothetical protein